LETAETNSANSATASANSATASANSATASEASKVTSVNSASTATTKASEASTSATSAAASYDLFDDRILGAKSSAPTVDNDGGTLVQGTLYFDTSSQTMKVYGSSGWVPAGSSVNGTSARFKFVATNNQTTFSGSDANSQTLGYDAGFLDVYLSGLRLVNGTDFTATTGTNIVLASGAATGDILEIVAYGTFVLANFNADKLDGQHGSYYTGYTDSAVSALVDSSPAALNTLNELAAALGDDVNFSTTVTNSIATKAPLANPTFTGTATMDNAHVPSSGSYEVGGSASGSTAIGSLSNSAGKLTLDTDSTRSIHFKTGGTLRQTIDGATGNLLVGTTDDAPGAGNTLAGVAIRGGSDNRSFLSANANYALHLNRNTSDGVIQYFAKSGVVVGSIGVKSGSIAFGQSNTGLGAFNTDRILFPATTSGVVQDAQIDLGYANGRFKDLYLSSGVYLGGTGAANKISDYEQGTWTMGMTTSNNNSNITINNTVGQYTKIGRLVTISIYNAGANIISAGTGGARITGLPFPVTNVVGAYGAASFAHTNAFSTTYSAYGAINTTFLQCTQVGSYGAAAWSAGNPKYFMLTFTYATT